MIYNYDYFEDVDVGGCGVVEAAVAVTSSEFTLPVSGLSVALHELALSSKLAVRRASLHSTREKDSTCMLTYTELKIRGNFHTVRSFLRLSSVSKLGPTLPPVPRCTCLVASDTA